jgi:iron complex outermembrane recepter protein
MRAVSARAVALSFLIAGVLGGAASAASQEGGIVQGRVVATESAEPLPAVSISIEGTGLGTITNASGSFRIANVPPGTYRVVARRLGREPGAAEAVVATGESVELGFQLREAAVLLPEVVVSATGEARRLSQTAASVGVVGGETLRGTRPTHPADVMGQIPGVWISVTGGEGHMTGIRHPKTTSPLYLFLEDGVPTRSTGFFNHNALYEVNVPQADRIEVLKGPASALHGSDAIGGVVNVESRRPSSGPEMEAYGEGGAWGHARLLLSGSNTRGSDGIRADLNLTRTDGWRDGTGYDRQSATLRWDHRIGGTSGLRTVLSASRIDQQTAGSAALLRDDFLQNPTANYTPISYRRVRALRLSSAYERETDGLRLSVTPYARWNEMELLPNWALTFDPTVSTSGHSSVGALLRARRDVAPLRTRLIAGADLDFSPGSRIENRITTQRQGQFFTAFTPAELIYDYDVTFHGISPYLQAEANATDRLHLSLGLRYDWMGYAYTNHLGPLHEGRWRRPADARLSFTRLSPKVGATYDFGRGLNVYANYAHGFRAPSEGQIFRQGPAENTIDLRPVASVSYETGVRGELLGRLGYGATAYRMTITDDIVSFIHADGLRETQNAGKTIHEGLETALGVAVTDEFRADLSYALARHTYGHWSPRPEVDYSGNEMASAPRTILNARLGYVPDYLPASRFSLEWNRIGSYWMDPENTHRYQGHGIWNVQANLPLPGSLELNARMTNLLDARVAEHASYTAARGEEYAPGLPRSLYLGLQYRWAGGGR